MASRKTWCLWTDLTTITNPDARSRSFGYLIGNHKITSEAQGILENQYGYNGYGLLTQWRWGALPSESLSLLTSVAVQGLASLVRGTPRAVWTSPLGYKTSYLLDLKGRLLELLEADGALTRISRDSSGRVQSITDPLNRTTTFTRDSKGYIKIGRASCRERV